MFAVVRVGNKQFKVVPKDVIVVDKMPGTVGDTVNLPDVLLVHDEKKVEVGKPVVKGHKVTAKIIAQEKGEKIDIHRFRSKVNYRRAKGFRAQLTRLEILSVA
ncbi:MAG: 50S ribosomal protein L21 [Patescibacteria group bacterium]